MRIVKVNATASTNTYLKEYSRSTDLREDILLWTEVQKKGRGQRGSFWESDPYKNLTFSIYKSVNGISANEQFYITMAASLAVYELLDGLGVKRLSIKWPNDILAGSRKICGILIESIIKNGDMSAVIIGVGININQTVFNHAPRATSVKLETGKTNDLQRVLLNIPSLFEEYVDNILARDFKNLKLRYESLLFRRDVPSVFEKQSGNSFMGIIEGVSPTGLLLLKDEDGNTFKYDLKEIKLLY